MDESALGKAKYHKGRALGRDSNWVVGAIDTETGRIAVQSVENRNQGSLMGFTQQVITPQTMIYTDQWPGYNPLEANGYSHLTLTHS